MATNIFSMNCSVFYSHDTLLLDLERCKIGTKVMRVWSQKKNKNWLTIVLKTNITYYELEG